MNRLPFFKTMFATVALLMAFGCASSEQTLRRQMSMGQAAFQEGDVLAAYRMLSSASIKSAGFAEYPELYRQVTEAAEFLIERWLEKGNFWKAQGDLAEAHRYYSDVLQGLPQEDPMRGKFESLIQQIQASVDQLRRSRDRLVEEGKSAFRQGRFAEARSKMIAAKGESLKAKLPFELLAERILEESNRRSPLVEIAPSPPSSVPGIKVDGREASRRTRIVRPAPIASGAHATPSPGAPGGGTAPNESPEQLQLQLQLEQARRLSQDNLAQAVLKLREILAQYPGQPEAQEQLSALDFKIKQVIEELSKQASDHFAHEELEKAVPLYQQILVLDPDNQRAKEGLEMYNRLKRIKEKQLRNPAEPERSSAP